MKYFSVLVFFILICMLLCGCTNIGGDSLQNYTIVYADIDSDEKNVLLSANYADGTDFNLYSAQALQSALKEKFGVELPIQLDADFPVSDKEILVGKTNRNETAVFGLNNLDEQQFVVKANGSRLQICGGCYGATWQAVQHVVESFETDCIITSTGVVANCDISRQSNLKVVACVGDSITWGSESISDVYLSYPAFLQRTLWKDCIIKKYAQPGMTMHDQVEYYGNKWAYTGTAVWQKCLNDAETFDYVLIMLGTNDAWYMQFTKEPWAKDYETKFIESFLRILQQLQNKNQSIEYVLMNCPRCFANGYNTYEICNYQANGVMRAASEGYNVSLFDMDAATRNISQLTYAADGLHPNAKGYKIIADIVAQMLATKLNLH